MYYYLQDAIRCILEVGQAVAHQIRVRPQQELDDSNVIFVDCPMHGSLLVLASDRHICILLQQGFHNAHVTTFCAVNQIGVTSSILENNRQRYGNMEHFSVRFNMCYQHINTSNWTFELGMQHM